MFVRASSQRLEPNAMRKLPILCTLLLCTSSSFAADVAAERWRISVLAAEISTEKSSFAGSDVWGDDPHAGVALGVAYAPAPQWDVELTIASQTHRSPYTPLFYTPTPNGPGWLIPATEFHDYRVNPVDLSVTRHFLMENRIAPYVRAGVRYVNAPNDPATIPYIYPSTGDIPLIQVHEGYGFDDRVSVQAGAGMRVRLTPRTALRAEATRLLRSEESDFDPLLRYAVGLSWAF